MPHHPRLAPHASRVALAALACVAAACNPLSRKGRAPAAAEPVVVVFENQSLYEARVYAVGAGGQQVRIGTVQPGRTDTLRLRGNVLPPGSVVTLVARLLAVSRTPSTGPLSLQPGQRIAVTLSPQANVLGVLPLSP